LRFTQKNPSYLKKSQIFFSHKICVFSLQLAFAYRPERRQPGYSIDTERRHGGKPGNWKYHPFTPTTGGGVSAYIDAFLFATGAA
jgi:hypothetical protein